MGKCKAKRGIEVNPEKIKVLVEMRTLKPKEVHNLIGWVAALSHFISKLQQMHRFL